MVAIPGLHFVLTLRVSFTIGKTKVEKVLLLVAEYSDKEQNRKH